MGLDKETKRLSDIEARLLASWRQADENLDIESNLLRCAELRQIKRRCEIYLGYVPSPKEDENTPKE